MDMKDLKNRFDYHVPIIELDQTDRYEKIRNKAKNFARYLISVTPDSREQSLAITSLEEVVFWANAAIARHEVKPETSDV